MPDLTIHDGWLTGVKRVKSPHFDARPTQCNVSLLVIHNISLPPGEFGGGFVAPFFMGELEPHLHPFFKEIHKMRVSAHCFIARDGVITQFVSFAHRAWHAGVSVFQGQDRCNDVSIGIEMEGVDDTPYTEAQYRMLTDVTQALMVQYPKITLGRIVGHNDIAPGRKTDPGVAFDWCSYRQRINNRETNDLN